MKNEKISFIGGGNMALAIASGLVQCGRVKSSDITIYEISKERREKLIGLGFNAVANAAMLGQSRITFLAVKPAHAKEALEQYAQSVCTCDSCVSIIAGISAKEISRMLLDKFKVIRIMPNTPTLVGMGMFAVSDDYTASRDTVDFVIGLLGCIGSVTEVPARLMDAVTAVSGSGPAYVFMFIDAMINAGVRAGLSREQASALTLQTVIGSANMVKQTGKSPSDLKDMVCSPAGTTIEAVYALEKNGFSAAIMEAVKKCEEKSREMSNAK
ncbi:MAG: pyrroline-5-carboxylate reductase [Oscillospiraceae bacterium]|nr:MAG: pyrroline-5-carboxylate reductase [Oscillospiraceae bacterium]